MTVWQDNAALAASTPDTYIDQERHFRVREALGMLTDPTKGRGRAQVALAATVTRQARIAGLGTIPIPCCPACGFVCTHGGAA